MNLAPKIPARAGRVLNWPWAAPLLILVLSGLSQLIIQRWEPGRRLWPTAAIYLLAAGLMIWWLRRQATRQAQLAAELWQATAQAARTRNQLLAVHDLGARLAAAANTQQVLELAVRAPGYLTNAVGSLVVSFDEERERLKLDMAWGLSDAFLQALRQRVEAGLPGERCQSCRPLTARLYNGCPLFDGMEGLAQADGIQSLVCVPITCEQKRTGIISAYFPSPDGPPAEQMQLLNIVATEIAAALEGVRQRTGHMEALYAVEHLTQSRQDTCVLLEQVLDITLAGWGLRSGSILLRDPGGEAWAERVQRGLGESPEQPSAALAARLAETAIERGEPVLIPDLAALPPGAPGCDPEPGSAAAAPLIAGGELLGALVLAAERAHFFQPHHAPFFSTIAHQAALAINNARLQARVQQLATLEERFRLSREMHDGLAQTLSSLGWQTDHLRTLLSRGELAAMEPVLATTRQLIHEAYLDVREAIDGLRDPPGSLRPTLETYLAEFETRTGIRATLETEGAPVPLRPETELQLLRIVQEALSNVRKHAAAGQVWVRLRYQRQKLALTIADDGRGFDPALPPGRGHVGLATMRERAESQGGELTLVTGPNQGTRLTITVPSNLALNGKEGET